MPQKQKTASQEGEEQKTRETKRVEPEPQKQPKQVPVKPGRESPGGKGARG